MGRLIFQKSCGVVPVHVTEDGEVRFLLLNSGLVRNPKATWEFPKGSVEEGESEIETALRECAEETGLCNVRLVPGFRALDTYFFHRDGGRIKKRVVYFLALVSDPEAMKPEPDGREHVLDAEGRWFRWLSYKETWQALFHSGQRRVLATAYAHLTALGYDQPGAALRLPGAPEALYRKVREAAARHHAESASRAGGGHRTEASRSEGSPIDADSRAAHAAGADDS